MQKFRKKPVVIEAVQFTDDELSIPTIKDFMQTNIVGNKNGTGKLQEIIISTLEGEMTAIKSDWIIKGVRGEFYPIKNDIFLETYELVEEN